MTLYAVAVRAPSNRLAAYLVQAETEDAALKAVARRAEPVAVGAVDERDVRWDVNPLTERSQT